MVEKVFGWSWRGKELGVDQIKHIIHMNDILKLHIKKRERTDFPKHLLLRIYVSFKASL